MAIERISPFDFTAGVVALAQEGKPATLPLQNPSPPLLGEAPVASKLEKLFQGNRLNHLELDSMALPPETLHVLSKETLKSLIEDADALLLCAEGIAPMHEIECVEERLKEDRFNQELLAAFRRAILGG